MTGKTHLAGGLAAGLVLERVTAMAGVPIIPPSLMIDVAGLLVPASVLAFTAIGAGSLLPDLDEPRSMAANMPNKTKGVVREVLRKQGTEGVVRMGVEMALSVLNLFSRLLSALIRVAAAGHRGATHWLVTCLAVSVLAGLAGLGIGFPDLGFWLFLGCLSHLVLDMMTISGLEVLMPFSEQKFHLLPKGLRVRTGNFVDYGLTFLFSLIAVSLVYLSMASSIG